VAAYSAMVGGDSLVAGLLPPPDNSAVTPSLSTHHVLDIPKLTECSTSLWSSIFLQITTIQLFPDKSKSLCSTMMICNHSNNDDLQSQQQHHQTQQLVYFTTILVHSIYLVFKLVSCLMFRILMFRLFNDSLI